MQQTSADKTAAPFTLVMPDTLSVPLLISIPHCGTLLTQEFRQNAASSAILALPDTDWFVHQLYDFAKALNIGLIHANYSRYIIDLNRPLPGGTDLYKSRGRTTGLVPLTTFSGQAIYRAGAEPTEQQVSQRITQFYSPYYAQIDKVLQQLKDRFGVAMLYDGHSILGQVEAIQAQPFVDYMPANRSGITCADAFIDTARQVIEKHGGSCAANGPFQGGNITRSFHDEAQSIFSFQMEISQRIYMNEHSGEKCQPQWSQTVAVLREIIERFSAMLLSMAADKQGL